MLSNCIICKNDSFDILLNYKKNKVVTSDNKIIDSSFMLYRCKNCFQIQKKIDRDLNDILNLIYQNYEAYYLSGGKEEEKLNINNKITNRSQMILENIKKIIPKNGKILDIGTGTGIFLEEFSKLYNWKLYAQDIKIDKNNNLANIQGFEKFFIAFKDKIDENYFDIISAIHVVEHILDINDFLVKMRKSLNKNGMLLLQVPNSNENIFDFFTIDHVLHFNRYTIGSLLKKYFKYVYFTEKQISREITVIATDKPIHYLNEQSYQSIDIDFKYKINNLLLYLNTIDKKVAIFGTSPPALFCAAYLKFNILYFIDENENKQNKHFYGKIILSPNLIEEEIDILFPYSKDMVKIIKRRYPKLNFISLDL